MKKNLQMPAVLAAITASFLFGCSSAPPRVVGRTDPNRPSIVQTQEGYDTVGVKWEDEAKPVTPTAAPAATPKMLTRNDFVLLHFTGKIIDIDHTDRELTLQDSEGRIETFSVDKKVQRFNEAKVGDKVSMSYYLGFNAEVRKPTPEEEQNPLIVTETSGRAGPDAPPAAREARHIRAVVTIEALDRQAKTLTVKGPRGKHFTARVVDPSRLEQVSIGDTIVLTFTESAAVSLEPLEKATAN
jgi:hypothetical protein